MDFYSIQTSINSQTQEYENKKDLEDYKSIMYQLDILTDLFNTISTDIDRFNITTEDLDLRRTWISSIKQRLIV
jgi:hypothetical protein